MTFSPNTPSGRMRPDAVVRVDLSPCFSDANLPKGAMAAAAREALERMYGYFGPPEEPAAPPGEVPRKP